MNGRTDARAHGRTETPTGRHARIRLTVNGEERDVVFAGYKSLLEVLREDLGLTGTNTAASWASAAPARSSWTGSRCSRACSSASSARARTSPPSRGWRTGVTETFRYPYFSSTDHGILLYKLFMP